MQQTRIQPAADRPAPRPIAEADEAAARRFIAERELRAFARDILIREARRNSLAMIRRPIRRAAPIQQYGVFDGDRLVETHTDPEVARLAAADNADATGRPGAYTVEPLCLTCRDLPAGDCNCP
ncbi:hypothetical protein ABZ671_18880 [Micromonospora sp. NPDC006766]|uniref:hypothetical protein n=1 Tax=Micromonospora sp. NPDC006766 TaxID=3154778 RepID=UPI0033E6D4B3